MGAIENIFDKEDFKYEFSQMLRSYDQQRFPELLEYWTQTLKLACDYADQELKDSYILSGHREQVLVDAFIAYYVFVEKDTVTILNEWGYDRLAQYFKEREAAK